jgi:hypothetical protein
MPTIRILAFRGTGGLFDEEDPHYTEPALIRAGHVALADVIEAVIIGFSPTSEAAEKLGGEKALLLALQKHQAQTGRLQDDTTIFERAQALALQGERTEVLELVVEISEETLATIKSWYNEKKESLYNLPIDEEGEAEFKDGEYNCATFPSFLDIPSPALTGLLRDYLYAMRQKGAKSWTR